MSNIHKLISGDKEYTLNFNSYAIMQAYKKYGTEGLSKVETENPFGFIFDMIKFGLSDNGRKEWDDADVHDIIDNIGGINSDRIKEISGWIASAFGVPESKKKDE